MVLLTGLRNWGLRRQMGKPETSATAYQAALPKVHEEPKLALAILTGSYTRAEKLAVIEQVRAALPYADLKATTEPFPALTALRTLPPFFKLLAKQKRQTISAVWDLWTSNGKENVKTHDFSAAAAAHLGIGYKLERADNLAITANSFQLIAGYKAESSNECRYFATGCEIEGLPFAYQFRV